MPRCKLHPGREAVWEYNRVEYCAKCKTGILTAVGDVRPDVSPNECFIWYCRNDEWKPIAGTGCAHWVAHEKDIQSGRADDKCLFGYTYRVHVLAGTYVARWRWKMSEAAISGLAIRKISAGVRHSIMPNLYPDEMPEITILPRFK